jgi:hypothetical protein
MPDKKPVLHMTIIQDALNNIGGVFFHVERFKINIPKEIF